jgi:hypothetical protein
MRRRGRQSGYVALLAVLIVGAASVVIASGLLLTSTDSQRITLASQRLALARNNALACAEEALQQIHDSQSFTTGGTNLVLATGTCSYAVANTGGNNRTITATSSVSLSLRRVIVTLTRDTTTMTILTWQETS